MQKDENHWHRSENSKNQYQLNLYWGSVNSKSSGVPALLESALRKKNKELTTSNWASTLALTTKQGSFFILSRCSVRQTSWSCTRHSAGCSIPSLCSTAGLDLCCWQGHFSPAQCAVGNLERDRLSIYRRRPLPSLHVKVFFVKSIDQHFKFGPGSEDRVTSLFLHALTRHVTAYCFQRCEQHRHFDTIKLKMLPAGRSVMVGNSHTSFYL